MSQETIKNDLQTYFSTNYSSTNDIVYQNESYNPQIDTEYTKFDILFGQDRPIDVGQKQTYRQNGIINIDLFLNEDNGLDKATQIADILTGLFRNKVISNIVTDWPIHDYIGDENGFYRYNFQVAFRKDVQEA